MALGIEQNSIAPQLIANAGQSLVQGIRQIGQQISGHLTELQTKRDLGALAQEMQSVNPQSNDFPVQLTQLVSRHPMAARDERGQMVLGILGKAHGQWQAGEAEARAFNRAMAMQTARTTAARTAAEEQEQRIRTRPVEVSGVGLADPVTGDVLIPEKPRMTAGSTRPSVLAPGAVLVDPTGKKLAENPKAATASTSEARMLKKNKIDLLMRQDAAARAEFGRLEKRRDDLSQERMKISKADDPNAAYLDNTVKAIEEEAAALKKRREEIQKAIEAIEITPADEDMVPAGAVAPPAAGANVQRVPVLDPNGQAMLLRADQVEAALQNGWKRR